MERESETPSVFIVFLELHPSSMEAMKRNTQTNKKRWKADSDWSESFGKWQL
jgi:hypothetical protein